MLFNSWYCITCGLGAAMIGGSLAFYLPAACVAGNISNQCERLAIITSPGYVPGGDMQPGTQNCMMTPVSQPGAGESRV